MPQVAAQFIVKLPDTEPATFNALDGNVPIVKLPVDDVIKRGKVAVTTGVPEVFPHIIVGVPAIA